MAPPEVGGLTVTVAVMVAGPGPATALGAPGVPGVITRGVTGAEGPEGPDVPPASVAVELKV